MAIGTLTGGRGLGHHLDHRAAAPGGQSRRWLISGTGPQCAVLQEEETEHHSSLHSGLLKVLTPLSVASTSCGDGSGFSI